jgi:hypothetical protein
METNIHFLYFASVFLEWDTFQIEVVKKIKTHIFYSVNFFSKIMLFFEIMWKNLVELGRPQITKWCMCIVCWITKATNTLSEYVLLTAFPLQQWLHECTSLLCYTYFACHVEKYWKCQHIISFYLLYLEVIYKRRPWVIFRENR